MMGLKKLLIFFFNLQKFTNKNRKTSTTSKKEKQIIKNHIRLIHANKIHLQIKIYKKIKKEKSKTTKTQIENNFVKN